MHKIKKIIEKKMQTIQILTILITLLSLFTTFFAKALDKKTIELLKKDQFTMDNYKARYRYLSCKLLIYGKLKYMFETERIDTFAAETANKREFVDIYYDEMLKKCNRGMTDTDVKF